MNATGGRRRSPVLIASCPWHSSPVDNDADPVPTASDYDDERVVILARDTPTEFLPMLEAIAHGDFAAAGIVDQDAKRAE